MEAAGGGIFNVLPFVEEEDVYQLQAGKNGSARRDAASQMISTPLSIMHCPSRREATVYETSDHHFHFRQPMYAAYTTHVARSDYAANAGDTYTEAPSGALPNGGSGPVSPSEGVSDAWKKKWDAIADIALQQVLTRPKEFDVIATLNLNGDYLSDALAAQVGGIGIAPGGNINYDTGHAIFEATHGTAPKYTDLDMVNPSSVILSGVLMFNHLGWTEVGERIVQGIERSIEQKRVTYDFERLMDGATKLPTSGFGQAIIDNMD